MAVGPGAAAAAAAQQSHKRVRSPTSFLALRLLLVIGRELLRQCEAARFATTPGPHPQPQHKIAKPGAAPHCRRGAWPPAGPATPPSRTWTTSAVSSTGCASSCMLDTGALPRPCTCQVHCKCVPLLIQAGNFLHPAAGVRGQHLGSRPPITHRQSGQKFKRRQRSKFRRARSRRWRRTSRRGWRRCCRRQTAARRRMRWMARHSRPPAPSTCACCATGCWRQAARAAGCRRGSAGPTNAPSGARLKSFAYLIFACTTHVVFVLGG